MYSMQLIGGPAPLTVRVKTWPDTSIRMNIEWEKGDHWIPCDRGAAGDQYEARVTFFGTKAEMDALDQWLEDYGRGTFQIAGATFMPFSPMVNHSGEVTVLIVDREKKKRVFWSTPENGVDEWTMTLLAIQPTLTADTVGSLAALRLQEKYEHDKETPITTGIFGGGLPFALDNQADLGVFRGSFFQRTEEMKAILRYLLVSTRAAAFPIPSIGVEYPFGRALGGLPKNCRCAEIDIRRDTLHYWTLDLTLVEAP